jgi:Protein of unknown function (DUF3300)
MEGSRRVLMLAFAGVLFFGLTSRWPVAGQQLSQENTPVTVDTPEQLQQLVAPIALYPDALVAQVLAASTYPTQVVQADRWLQQHANLQGEQLAAAVDQQPWDPSVKALTAFPSVMANLDKNLSWTEGLGDAYFNQQQDVLDAVQVMRRQAQAAGNLQSTAQQRVVNAGTTIVIQPAYPDLCYLPTYNPWIVYGAPLPIYPGYFYDAWVGSPFISFGPAIGLGFFSGFGWGWPAWGFNWGSRVVVFNHNPYVSRSRYFFDRAPFFGSRGVLAPRAAGRGFTNRAMVGPNGRVGNRWANRGSLAARANRGVRTGAFNSVRPGGSARGPVLRGGSSGGRTSFHSGRSFGGGPRGGGARGAGSGGRHR